MTAFSNLLLRLGIGPRKVFACESLMESIAIFVQRTDTTRYDVLDGEL